MKKIGLQKNVQYDHHFVQRYDIDIQFTLGCRIINEFLFSDYFAFLCVFKQFSYNEYVIHWQWEKHIVMPMQRKDVFSGCGRNTETVNGVLPRRRP